LTPNAEHAHRAHPASSNAFPLVARHFVAMSKNTLSSMALAQEEPANPQLAIANRRPNLAGMAYIVNSKKTVFTKNLIGHG